MELDVEHFTDGSEVIVVGPKKCERCILKFNSSVGMSSLPPLVPTPPAWIGLLAWRRRWSSHEAAEAAGSVEITTKQHAFTFLRCLARFVASNVSFGVRKYLICC